MQTTWKKALFLGAGGTMLLGLAYFAAAVPALAQRQGNNAADPDALVLIYPTGDRATSSLLVEAMAPAEVPVGKRYDYMIRVTNLTRNLVLEDVKIHQQTPDGFTIEDSSVASQANSGDQGGNTKKDQGDSKKDQGDSKKDQGANHKNQGHKSGSGSGDDASSGSAKGEWTVDRLGPGESKTIKVTAVGDQEGTAKSCIQVSYKPTLCVATRFVKPQIGVAKTAPDTADICRPLEFRYEVKNTGTGVAKNLTLNDDLPEGLTTADGKDKVSFDVGDLAAGQARDFSVRVNAAKTGEFSSRAVAKGEGDLEAHSKRTTTEIVGTDLAVNITGPRAQYVGQPMTYQVHVKNTGKADAVESRLEVQVDSDAKVVRMSKPDQGNTTPTASGNTLTWNLGTLKAGGERTVSFTAVGQGTGEDREFKHIATATSACARGGDVAETARDRAETVTQILTLPALLLEMVDRVDPVKVGDEEIYTIVVRNQGSGPDRNVTVKCELPEQFKFVDSSGATKAKADGQTITFGPIDQLGPKEKVSWNLRVKAEKPGDVRNKIELTSDYLQKPVPELEPTRVIANERNSE